MHVFSRVLSHAFANSRNAIWLLFGVLSALPMGATAAPVTYDFTGTVTSTQGALSTVAIGSTVTGTYTIDFNNMNGGTGTPDVPTTTSGQYWDATARTGSVWSHAPGPSIFVSTLYSSNTLLYTSAPSGPIENDSIIEDYLALYSASEYVAITYNDYTSSGFDLTNGGWYSNGLPIPVGAGTAPNGWGSGNVSTSLNGTASSLHYTLTSLTPVSPVPLPATAWLLLSGLGGLGVLVRRRRTA